jgi:calcineurin-like phosphoesterase family protein
MEFFVSDTHFCHERILSFTNENGKLVRPEFKDVNEMNQCMIDNWNSVVGEKDVVYHLGDVGFEKYKTDEIMEKLHGVKYLIIGNHDDVRVKWMRHFKKAFIWLKFSKYDFIASHMPLHESSLFGIKYNVHGHIHEKADPSPVHLNISVEKTNYSPISLEEVVRRLKEKG